MIDKGFDKKYLVRAQNFGLFESDAFFLTGWSGVLPSKAKDIYLALKSYMNASNVAWPSTKRLEIDTLMNGTDIRTSVEFLNLIGLLDILERGNSISGKSTEYRLRDMYTLNMVLEFAFLDSLYELLVKRKVELRLKKEETKKDNEKVFIERLDKVKQYIEHIKENDIKLIFRIRGQLEEGTTIPDYRYYRNSIVIDNSTAYEYAEKSKLMVIKNLMQAVYTALRVSTKDLETINYNEQIFSLFLKKQKELRMGDINSHSENKCSDTDRKTPTSGTNNQFNNQLNIQKNKEEEAIITNTEFWDENPSVVMETKVIDSSKVKKLVQCIHEQLQRYGVSANKMNQLLRVLETKDVIHLEEVHLTFKILLDNKLTSKFSANAYATKICENPDYQLAKKQVGGFKSKVKESKNSKSIIEPTKRDFYDQLFGE